jgi:16S rRNA (adenine1518-N6/adenine1519-N6)-dimethyltransferase
MQEPGEIKTMDVLKKHGFNFKRKWGQNFLFDKNFLRRMAKGADIKLGDSVVEIGPGAGTLTKALLEEGARVLAVEIDEALIPVLRDVLQGMDAAVVCGDVLKMNIDNLVQEYDFSFPYKIVANLPYYITTPILMSILENEYRFELLVIMVQWEVAERLTAKPGTKEYGAITLAVNYYTESRILYKVPRHLFTPVPDVDSAVVCFTPRAEPPVKVRSKNFMFKIIKAGFNQRRKTLANSLLLVESNMAKSKLLQILDRAGIDSLRRGETLSLHEYAKLANTWQEQANHGSAG